MLLETPSNPMLEMVDLRAVAELAHEAGAIVVVDNVFATPLLQQPLQLGADVVVYSCTKHIDGQGRVLGGAVLANAQMDQRRAAAVHPQHRPGAVAVQRLGAAEGAGDAGAARRGRLSFRRRDRRFPGGAARGHARLVSDCAPTIRSRRWRCADERRRHGRHLRGRRRQGRRVPVMNAFRLIAVSNNLGDSKSLATHPATTTHMRIGEQERARLASPMASSGYRSVSRTGTISRTTFVRLWFGWARQAGPGGGLTGVRRAALTGPHQTSTRKCAAPAFHFFGRFALRRVDGRLAIDLSRPRVKPPEVMQGEWDHYDQIGVVPAACIDRPLNRTGCILGP